MNKYKPNNPSKLAITQCLLYSMKKIEKNLNAS